MEKSSYYVKWESWKSNYQEGKLPGFWKELNQDDWNVFWDDYLNDNTTWMLYIFRFNKLRIEEAILPFFKKVLTEKELSFVREKMISLFNQILASEVFEKDKFIRVLDIIDYLEISIPIDLLSSVFETQKYDQDVRINVSLILNQNFESQRVWKKIDIQENLFLLPFYMRFFERKKPYECLKILCENYKEKPENISQYFLPIKNCLISLFKYQTNLENFKKIDLPEWVREYIEELGVHEPHLRFLGKEFL